jgi:hypothetical protein
MFLKDCYISLQGSHFFGPKPNRSPSISLRPEKEASSSINGGENGERGEAILSWYCYFERVVTDEQRRDSSTIDYLVHGRSFT